MKRTLVVLLQSLVIASAGIGTTHADDAIGPGHPHWYGNGTGPTGADLIAWVSHRATRAPAGNPDPAHFGRSGGPVGAELIARLAKVQQQDQAFDLVNMYGRGAPTVQQLTQHATQERPVLASAPARIVK
jgi:hypothetical protein